MLRMVGKIYARILGDIVLTMTEGLTDDEKGGFQIGEGYADQIFTLRQTGEKAQERKQEGV